MIGLSFEIPNEYGIALGLIFKNLATKKYFWYNVNEYNQVFNKFTPNLAQFLFNKEIYSDIEFMKIINSHDYYIVFTKLQAYSKNTILKEITSYDEFINSECEVLIMIIDSIYVDIYSKDKKILNQIKKNVDEANFKNIIYIDEKSAKERFKNI